MNLKYSLYDFHFVQLTHTLEIKSVEASLACCLNQSQAAADQSLLAGAKLSLKKTHMRRSLT